MTDRIAQLEAQLLAAQWELQQAREREKALRQALSQVGMHWEPKKAQEREK